MPSVCLSMRESCQRHDCSELGTVRNWVDHCIMSKKSVASFSVPLHQFDESSSKSGASSKITY